MSAADMELYRGMLRQMIGLLGIAKVRALLLEIEGEKR